MNTKNSGMVVAEGIIFSSAGSSETTCHRTCFTRKTRGDTSTGRIVFTYSPFFVWHAPRVSQQIEAAEVRGSPRIPASVSATYSSTVAEELLALIRNLHTLEAWNPLVNEFISAQLKSIVTMVTTVEAIEEEVSQVRF